MGSFLYAKPFLMALAIAQYRWDQNAMRGVIKGVAALGILIVGTGVLNLAAPTLWSSVFQRSGEVDMRYGLPSLVGPFVHQTYYGSIAMLVFLAVVCYRLTVKKSLLSLLLMVGTGASVIFSFRRRILLGTFIATLFGNAFRNKTRAIVGGGFAILCILVAAVASAAPGTGTGVLSTTVDTVYEEYVVNGDKAARTRLTTDSIGIGSDNFPLGAGYARFGSYLARTNYSQEYIDLGYREIYGLSDREGWGSWLTDTQWPSIVGESGFIGALLYLAGIGVMFRRFSAVGRTYGANAWLKCLALTGVSWTIATLFDSIASPVYTAPPTFPWIFALAAIVHVMVQRHPAEQSPAPVGTNFHNASTLGRA
ncbi:hypothetical protein [Rhodococcoides fascians]|uniref:hypothetical protein n=1 Tax=Rhodococcoides fascians TaxID=1828 RepID=UPI0024BB5A35|nr:hypothetical protein [Rhodococcus fascians]MDJ0467309.1 hypothetical protein [Rhodococcus fascians]